KVARHRTRDDVQHVRTADHPEDEITGHPRQPEPLQQRAGERGGNQRESERERGESRNDGGESGAGNDEPHHGNRESEREQSQHQTGDGSGGPGVTRSARNSLTTAPTETANTIGPAASGATCRMLSAKAMPITPGGI